MSTDFECDGCTACCKVLKIRELDKAGNVWCKHCKIGVGCGNYEGRPESCRVYECIWLQTQRLDKPIAFNLRPDKSRVVIGTTNHGEEMVFYVTPDRPNAWDQGDFRRLVAELRGRGIVMYVSDSDDLKRI
jgi:hypothetical protein